MSSSWLTAPIVRPTFLRAAFRTQARRTVSTTVTLSAEGTDSPSAPGFFPPPTASTSTPSPNPSDAPPRAPVGGYPAASTFPRLSRLGSLTGNRVYERVQEAKYHLHVQCTANNSIVTLTDARGSTIERGWWSGGSCGLKGSNRSGYEAGYQCAVRAFKRIQELEESTKAPLAVEVFFKGFGKGREAFFNALTLTEGESVRRLVTNLTDRTAIKIGGTRAKKQKRR